MSSLDDIDSISHMATHRKEHKKGKLWEGQALTLNFYATNRIYVEIKLFQNSQFRQFRSFVRNRYLRLNHWKCKEKEMGKIYSTFKCLSNN